MTSREMRAPSDVSHYIDLQRRVIAIFPYISCHKSNFDVFSVTLASILVDAGSLFDSLSQSYIREASAEGHQFQNAAAIKKLQDKISGDMNFNVGDYRELFEVEFKFSSRTVNLNVYGGDLCSGWFSGTQNPFPISPFKEWSQGKALGWWDSFTKLKHDRTMNMKLATLENLLHAAAANLVLLTEFHSEYLKSKVPTVECWELFKPLYWKVKATRTLIKPVFE